MGWINLPGCGGKTTMGVSHAIASLWDRSVGCALLGSSSDTSSVAHNNIGILIKYLESGPEDTVIEQAVGKTKQMNQVRYTSVTMEDSYISYYYSNVNGTLMSLKSVMAGPRSYKVAPYNIGSDGKFSQPMNRVDDADFIVLNDDISGVQLCFINAKLIVSKKCLKLDLMPYYQVGEGSVSPVTSIFNSDAPLNMVNSYGVLYPVNYAELVVGYDRSFIDSLITIAHENKSGSLPKGGSSDFVRACVQNNKARNVMFYASIYKYKSESQSDDYFEDLDVTALTDGELWFINNGRIDTSYIEPYALTGYTRSLGSKNRNKAHLVYFIGDCTSTNRGVFRIVSTCENGFKEIINVDDKVPSYFSDEQELKDFILKHEKNFNFVKYSASFR